MSLSLLSAALILTILGFFLAGGVIAPDRRWAPILAGGLISAGAVVSIVALGPTAGFLLLLAILGPLAIVVAATRERIL